VPPLDNASGFSWLIIVGSQGLCNRHAIYSHITTRDDYAGFALVTLGLAQIARSVRLDVICPRSNGESCRMGNLDHHSMGSLVSRFLSMRTIVSSEQRRGASNLGGLEVLKVA